MCHLLTKKEMYEVCLKTRSDTDKEWLKTGSDTGVLSGDVKACFTCCCRQAGRQASIIIIYRKKNLMKVCLFLLYYSGNCCFPIW